MAVKKKATERLPKVEVLEIYEWNCLNPKCEALNAEHGGLPEVLVCRACRRKHKPE